MRSKQRTYVVLVPCPTEAGGLRDLSLWRSSGPNPSSRGPSQFFGRTDQNLAHILTWYGVRAALFSKRVVDKHEADSQTGGSGLVMVGRILNGEGRSLHINDSVVGR